MRWTVFCIFAYVMLLLEISLRNTLRLDYVGGISPSFMAVLAAFIALFAQRLSALWACWIMGLLMDLASGRQSQGIVIIGPQALGFAFAGLVILSLRTMVFRRRLITMAVMTTLFVIASSVAAIFVLIVRHWFITDSGEPLHGLSALWRQTLVALYSGAVLGWSLGWVLSQSMSLWGFQTTTPRRTTWW